MKDTEATYLVNKVEVDKEHALKALCREYLGDKRDELTEKETFIAHLAGYIIKDISGAVWLPIETARAALFSNKFRLFSRNMSCVSPDAPHTEIEVLRMRVDALEKAGK